MEHFTSADFEYLSDVRDSLSETDFDFELLAEPERDV